MRAGDRLALELSEGARSRATSDELAELISRAIAPVVAHDGLRLVGTNPAAWFGPGSFSFWHGYDGDLGRAVLRRYYAGDDPCLPEELARRPVPAGVFSHGAATELRWLLRDARGVWGALALLRSGSRPFDRDDVNRVARLEPMLMSAVRRFAIAGPLAPTIPRIPAGVVIVGPDNVICAATPHARRWREVLLRSLLGPAWLGEASVLGLAAFARHPRAGHPAVTCAPSVLAGRWVAVEAQALDRGDVAVVFQAPTAEQLLPTFSDWYGITAREREILVELCDAAAPKQIARRLGLSVHTVNDHLKAVFRKTGAGSRAELMSALNG